MTIEPSFARKKKWTTKRDKSTVTYDFGTAQFEDGTIKCKKKKKNTSATERGKSTVMCNVDIT